ncbi:hypothetical protein [Asticcacaulis taihuensis]|uniref:hypothetical protein n=1 Tax=Asticcacaulis taihuensis TaxID=260084 RepID=UPI0026EA7982|nr:hypothetical protein [Asticcacaulis taihuensis]
MAYFKLSDTAGITYTRKGRLRLGSSAHYRYLEDHDGDTTVGDSQEVWSRNTFINILANRDDEDQSVIEALRLSGLAGNVGKNTRFVNCVAEQKEDIFLYCLTRCDYSELEKIRNSIDKKYNECIEVLSIYKLIDLISKAQCGNYLVKNAFNIYCDQVRYEDTQNNIFDNTRRYVAPDPFVKRTRYSDQKEYRILLQPSGSIIREKFNNRKCLLLDIGSENLPFQTA